MEFDNEEISILHNQLKEKTPQKKNKTFIKALENSDLSFLQEFLVSESRFETISSLSKFHKCKLLELLVEFFNQPLRLEAIKCAFEIMTDIGNIEALSRALTQRSANFNKLVFLKGKIDYLKYIKKNKNESVPENIYVEKM